MCGRTVVARSIGELVTLFDIDDVIGEQPGITYNNPPSLPASIIVDRVLKENEGEHAGELRRQLHAARWGLIPRNSQGPANTPLHNNARIETVLQKPTFRNAVLRQHCVMPVSGYYEWQIKEDGTKYTSKSNIEGAQAEKLYNEVINSGTPNRVIYGANLTVNEYGPTQYAQFFFFITGFHGFHVFSGVVINFIIFLGVLRGVYHRRGHYEMVEKTGLYWHFVDLVWVFVFTFFYLV